MSTNKIVLKTVIQFMQDYVPVYQPFYPLFMGKSAAYPQEVGKIDFKRLNTIGDIRTKHLTPKDTELKQISVALGTKTFKKYFLANQFIQSDLQDIDGNEDVIAQVLDEHHKQFDDLFLRGEGTSNSTMINNGLFWSNDPNYVLQNSVAVAAGADSDHLLDLHTQIMATAALADQISGQKALVIYGVDACARFDSIYSKSNAAFKVTLQGALGPNWKTIKLPLAVTPDSVNGWIACNLDQVKLHYTSLPTLKDRGVNAEKMYTWHNFLMGSSLLEVLALYGVIRQPCTFA